MQNFSSYSASTFSKQSTIGEKNDVLQPFRKQALVFIYLQYKSFENTVGKGDFGELSAISIELKIVVCKLFQFGRV